MCVSNEYKLKRRTWQYICLGCMKFWFVGELLVKTVTIERVGREDEAIPVSICRECFSRVYYCGNHEDKGSPEMFKRIPDLEYVSRQAERSIKEGKRLIRGTSPNLLFVG